MLNREYVAIPLETIYEEELVSAGQPHDTSESHNWILCKRVDDDFVILRGPCPRNCGKIYVVLILVAVALIMISMFLIFLHIVDIY